MSQFLGTHQNRLDAKGRVSIPAQFRTVLRATGNGEVGTSLVLRPSHKHACIEAWPANAFAALATPLDRLDVFSDEHDDFATALYADAYPLEADKEGRIVLPEEMIAQAGITDSVAFVGLSKTFQLWEPEAHKAHQEAMRLLKREQGVAVPAARAIAPVAGGAQ